MSQDPGLARRARRENTAHIERNGAVWGDKGRRRGGDFLAATPLFNVFVMARASYRRSGRVKTA
jgi:hypothetical protein